MPLVDIEREDNVGLSRSVINANFQYLSSLIGREVSVPASNSSTGTKGNWAYSAPYFYFCVGTDTWVRWVVEWTF